MKKLLGMIAPVFFTYDFESRILLEKSEVSTGEDVNGKVDFLWEDPSYNL